MSLQSNSLLQYYIERPAMLHSVMNVWSWLSQWYLTQSALASNGPPFCVARWTSEAGLNNNFKHSPSCYQTARPFLQPTGTYRCAARPVLQPAGPPCCAVRRFLQPAGPLFSAARWPLCCAARPLVQPASPAFSAARRLALLCSSTLMCSPPARPDVQPAL